MPYKSAANDASFRIKLMESYVSLDEFLPILMSARTKLRFSVKAERDQQIDTLRACVSAPLGINRFPDDGYYINLSRGPASNLFHRMLSSLDYSEREMDHRDGANTKFSCINDQKVQYTKSLDQLINICYNPTSDTTVRERLTLQESRDRFQKILYRCMRKILCSCDHIEYVQAMINFPAVLLCSLDYGGTVSLVVKLLKHDSRVVQLLVDPAIAQLFLSEAIELFNLIGYPTPDNLLILALRRICNVDDDLLVKSYIQQVMPTLLYLPMSFGMHKISNPHHSLPLFDMVLLDDNPYFMLQVLILVFIRRLIKKIRIF